LIIFAQNDLPSCNKAAALAFGKALRKKKCQADTLEVKMRDHITILLLVRFKNDPATKAMMAFINKHAPPEKRDKVTR
jgi:hypothetical protein